MTTATRRHKSCGGFATLTDIKSGAARQARSAVDFEKAARFSSKSGGIAVRSFVGSRRAARWFGDEHAASRGFSVIAHCGAGFHRLARFRRRGFGAGPSRPRSSLVGRQSRAARRGGNATLCRTGGRNGGIDRRAPFHAGFEKNLARAIGAAAACASPPASSQRYARFRHASRKPEAHLDGRSRIFRSHAAVRRTRSDAPGGKAGRDDAGSGARIAGFDRQY